MSSYPKYKASEPIEIENRVWPTRRITAAPIWVPVDLRDGNQAFARPMNVETKLRYFRMLCGIGFREIEVAYPAASTEEFEFVRRLIGEGAIPDGVRINVLTAARQDLIERTIEAIAGARAATVHCYIATSELHGRFVLGKTPEELMRTAVEGTRMIAEQVEAIKNIKIDKVTVWDSGEGKDGKNATAGFLSGLLKSLPPLEEMYQMAGLSLPKIVAPQKAEESGQTKTAGEGAEKPAKGAETARKKQ